MAGAEDIQRITVEDLASYYRTYCSPNNAILVVVGDATVNQVKDLTEKYFGDFEPQEIDRPRFKVAPPGQGPVSELRSVILIFRLHYCFIIHLLVMTQIYCLLE